VHCDFLTVSQGPEGRRGGDLWQIGAERGSQPGAPQLWVSDHLPQVGMNEVFPERMVYPVRLYAQRSLRTGGLRIRTCSLLSPLRSPSLRSSGMRVRAADLCLAGVPVWCQPPAGRSPNHNERRFDDPQSSSVAAPRSGMAPRRAGPSTPPPEQGSPSLPRSVGPGPGPRLQVRVPILAPPFIDRALSEGRPGEG